MKARFHLPDFAGHFKFNLVFCELLAQRPDFFREGVEIASFYGVFRHPYGTVDALKVDIVTKIL